LVNVSVVKHVIYFGTERIFFYRKLSNTSWIHAYMYPKNIKGVKL
jgi:hypothetical protein